MNFSDWCIKRRKSLVLKPGPVFIHTYQNVLGIGPVDASAGSRGTAVMNSQQAFLYKVMAEYITDLEKI